MHTVVSFDFAIAIVPGWHSTIFPPYFVAGAIYSGFAMVLCLAIPLRKFYGLEDFITARHLDNMGKIMLATGLIVAYGYMMEAFMAFYSADTYERYVTLNRMGGPYAAVYVINCAMWLERFVIVVISLHRDFVPSIWRMYAPTRWDWMTLVGSLGLFLTLIYLFIRYLPMISIFEMRSLVTETQGERR